MLKRFNFVKLLGGIAMAVLVTTLCLSWSVNDQQEVMELIQQHGPAATSIKMQVFTDSPQSSPI